MALVTRLYAGVCLSVQVIDNQFSFYGGNRRLHTRGDYINAKTYIRMAAIFAKV